VFRPEPHASSDTPCTGLPDGPHPLLLSPPCAGRRSPGGRSSYRGPVIDLDPTRARSWVALRAYWRQVRGVCGRCGMEIDYDGPRYVRVGGGRRRENPWALDVGHILGADLDPRQWWAPVDTRPEHARCNRRAGARYGNRKRAATRRSFLRTSQHW
jgi:hypothetical protein